MTLELMKEFFIDLAVFLVVVMATSFAGVIAFLVLPSPFFYGGLMVLTAIVFGVLIQRRLWAERLWAQREEILRQADAEAHGATREEW